MTQHEFITKLTDYAKELGYIVEYMEDKQIKESFILRIYHPTMKLPTFNSEVIGIHKEWTDGNIECWNYEFRDTPEWVQDSFRLNEKYLTKKKNYLSEFDKNMKDFYIKRELESIKTDF